MISDRDPFALARCGDGDDAEIRALFREWIAEVRHSDGLDDERQLDASWARQRALERQIADLPAQDAAGLAIKLYVHLHWADCNYKDDSAVVAATGDIWPHDAALLSDAARFVPEIAELVGEAEAQQ